MTPSEIETLIARWMDAELEESEAYRALHVVNDDYLEGVQLVLSTQFDEIDEALSECNYNLVATEARGGCATTFVGLTHRVKRRQYIPQSRPGVAFCRGRHRNLRRRMGRRHGWFR